MKTKERIVSKALELFNEHGIEYVGLRELAAHLGIRVSNITYYFPTKDHLVNQLSLDLGELNSNTIRKVDRLDMTGFMEMLEKTFENQTRYRCILLSFVHLLEQNPIMAKRYGETEATRNAALRANLLSLQKNDQILLASENDLTFLVSSLALIARFWISETTVSYRQLSIQEQIRHYLGLVARILLPYTTGQGKTALIPYL
ncbi:MAG: TetR family transcriptional regulator [Haliscomenobacter sp.]|nr:TetR family transcriptional regulator [Haliscomenobacter sp.]